MAQTIVMVATDPLDRPEPFKRAWPGGAEGPLDGQERVARAVSAKEKAIPVFVEALRSDQPLYRKAAVYSLSLCGPEAETALPALKEVMAADKDEEIRRYAQLALHSILRAGSTEGGEKAVENKVNY
jgi:HEAT repeat protein